MRKSMIAALLAGFLAQFAAFPVCAGELFIYNPLTVQAELAERGREAQQAFSFGAALPGRFENRWAGYAYAVPETCEIDAAWTFYQDIFYEQQDAVYDQGSATDMAVWSRDTSAEKPDPELDNADSYVVMSFFLSTKEGAPGQDVDAFAKKALRTATGMERLPDYAEVDEAVFGGYEWLHYQADYGEIMQRIYHDMFGADQKDHPAYEERYHYRMDLYFRQIDDKIMGVSTLASGKYYGQSEAMLAGFSKL